MCEGAQNELDIVSPATYTVAITTMQPHSTHFSSNGHNSLLPSSFCNFNSTPHSTSTLPIRNMSKSTSNANFRISKDNTGRSEANKRIGRFNSTNTSPINMSRHDVLNRSSTGVNHYMNPQIFPQESHLSGTPKSPSQLSVHQCQAYTSGVPSSSATYSTPAICNSYPHQSVAHQHHHPHSQQHISHCLTPPTGGLATAPNNRSTTPIQVDIIPLRTNQQPPPQAPMTSYHSGKADESVAPANNFADLPF